MPSPQRIAANRANAQRSTGPRTATGKEKSRRNALKHGLAIPICLDAEWSCEMTRLAHVIAGEGRDNPHILAAASRVAEATVSVFRVRRVKTAFFDVMSRDPYVIDMAIAMFAKHIAGLDRYERRALSQRRTAIRALNEARDALQYQSA